MICSSKLIVDKNVELYKVGISYHTDGHLAHELEAEPGQVTETDALQVMDDVKARKVNAVLEVEVDHHGTTLHVIQQVVLRGVSTVYLHQQHAVALVRQPGQQHHLAEKQN